MPNPTSPTPLAACLLSIALGQPAAAQEVSERDHKDIAKHIQEYLDAAGDEEEKIEAKEGLRESLEKLGKRLVAKGGDPLQAALARTDDLGQALRLARPMKSKKAGAILEGETEAYGSPVTYRVWVPSAYKHSGDPFPAVICLPGLGDTGPMSPDQFLIEHWGEEAARVAREGALIAAVALPAEVDAWGAMQDASGEPGGVACTMATLASLRRDFAIDPDRLYILGREAAAATAVQIGGLYPHLFAGVVGQAGDAGQAGWANYSNLPTLFQGGGAEATAFSEGAAAFGNCTLLPQATCDEIWAWMQEHPRVSNPTKVTLVPGAPIPNKAYWVEVPPIDAAGDISITAEANRADNTVMVTSQGMNQVILYFNDELLDLDKPIKLTLNGVTQELLVPRSLDDFLALIERGTSDSGKLYVARGTYDLP
jgi:hypothetical protein